MSLVISTIIMQLIFSSSFSGLTRGSIFTNAEVYMDSRGKPDYDELGAEKVEPQNSKISFGEYIYV